MLDKIKKILYMYYNTYKSFPSKKYLSEKINVSISEIDKALDLLVKHEVLIVVNGKYKVISLERLTVKEETKEEEKPKEKEPSKEAPELINKINSLIPIIIKFAMFGISAVAMAISIYYSWYWIKDFLPFVFALFLAFSMVLYITFAFLSLKLLKNKNTLLKVVLILTACISMLFSMLSTVLGQYNKNIAEQNKRLVENIENDKDTFLVSEYEKEINEILIDIQDVKKEIDLQLKTLNRLSTKEWTYYHTEKNIKALKNDRLKKEKRLLELRKLKEDLIKNSKGSLVQNKEKRSSYAFLAGVFGIKEDLIKFILSLFPALFIDIMAPLGMSIAFREKA